MIPPITGATEEYNGSTWTSGNPICLNTARHRFSRVQELQTAALAFGGENSTCYRSNRII
jgi:hypothetical protein